MSRTKERHEGGDKPRHDLETLNHLNQDSDARDEEVTRWLDRLDPNVADTERMSEVLQEGGNKPSLSYQMGMYYLYLLSKLPDGGDVLREVYAKHFSHTQMRKAYSGTLPNIDEVEGTIEALRDPEVTDGRAEMIKFLRTALNQIEKAAKHYGLGEEHFDTRDPDLARKVKRLYDDIQSFGSSIPKPAPGDVLAYLLIAHQREKIAQSRAEPDEVTEKKTARDFMHYAVSMASTVDFPHYHFPGGVMGKVGHAIAKKNPLRILQITRASAHKVVKNIPPLHGQNLAHPEEDEELRREELTKALKSVTTQDLSRLAAYCEHLAEKPSKSRLGVRGVKRHDLAALGVFVGDVKAIIAERMAEALLKANEGKPAGGAWRRAHDIVEAQLIKPTEPVRYEKKGPEKARERLEKLPLAASESGEKGGKKHGGGVLSFLRSAAEIGGIMEILHWLGILKPGPKKEDGHGGHH